MSVYKAIAAVQAELAEKGIAKGKTNEQQGYKFRGVDDVYTALAPLLSKHGLCMLPRFVERSVTERQTKSGGVLFYTVVEGEFDLVSVEDGSKHMVKTYGEAMDSGDKSTNKAMSAAYKYAAFQAFCIPVDTEDSDKDTHKDIKPKESADPFANLFDPSVANERQAELVEKLNRSESGTGKTSTAPTETDDAAKMASLKRKVWAKAKEANITEAQIKEYSTVTLAKPSSKEWTVKDIESVLSWIEYKRGN